jgi:uncharacterized protein YndB with AHSA1/START domain
MIEHRGRRVELAWTLGEPGEKVWAAWTDPRHVAGWFADRAEGQMTPGGVFTWHWDAMGLSAANQVAEAEPGKRLVLGCGERLLEVRFIGGGSRTGIKLVNSGLPEDEDEVLSVRSGWLLSVALLRKYLALYWGREKRQVLGKRELNFDFARVIECYRLPKREEWLGGTPPVLEDSGREVALDWVERQGVLELKAWALNGRRWLGMRANSWDGAPMEEWPQAVEDALDRLQPLLS